MLGSTMMRQFPQAFGTTRGGRHHERLLPRINIRSLDDISKAFDWATPDVVLNCAGIVKSECVHHPATVVSDINLKGPHRIAYRALSSGKCRVIHFSTDCVFSGAEGNYTEEYPADATDIYGSLKRHGELSIYANCVTLRASFIGRDPIRGRGLLEWLLAQSGPTVPGHANAIWSGLSTTELARITAKVIDDTEMSGLYHVAGPRISKFELLVLLTKAFNLPHLIEPQDEPRVDRSLDGSKIARRMNYSPPDWSTMAAELAEENRV